jgi:hypothetical protein
LQHGAEFVTDLLVDQGDNLGVRNHVKASSGREGIAIDFLTSESTGGSIIRVPP